MERIGWCFLCYLWWLEAALPACAKLLCRTVPWSCSDSTRWLTQIWESINFILDRKWDWFQRYGMCWAEYDFLGLPVLPWIHAEGSTEVDPNAVNLVRENRGVPDSFVTPVWNALSCGVFWVPVTTSAGILSQVWTEKDVLTRFKTFECSLGSRCSLHVFLF